MADPPLPTIAGLAGEIRAGRLSVRDVVEAALARIAAINGRLNAVVRLDEERALARAGEADRALAAGETWGPLHGIPFTIKDSFDTAGLVTTWGTVGRRDFVPAADATVVARLLRAGGILLGKTNTPEFTLSFETDNRVYGRTNHPLDPTRTPGGSSGGAAAIVAAGAVPFDIGSDTGGSIRLPAHFCGVAGLKPTTGRVPRTGHCPPPGGLVNELTQIGPIARTVDDLALLFELITGPDGVDPYIAPVPLGDPAAVDVTRLRGAYFLDNGLFSPDAEVAAATRQVVERLRQAGAVLAEALPDGIEETLDLIAPLMRGWDGGSWVRLLLARSGTPEAESTLGRYLAAPGMAPAETIALFDRLDRYRGRMLAFWRDFDYLICPPAGFTAPEHGGVLARYPGTSYTMAFNLTGWPAGVVPAGAAAGGLPAGVQVAAPPWREDIVLAVLRQIEQLTMERPAPGV